MSQQDDRLNANQFDEAGLPGIDENYPPEKSWAVDDPALVNGGSETQDDLATRVARENADPVVVETAPTPGPLVDPDDGDPAGSVVDTEKQLLADQGMADPDAPMSAEEAAMHVEPPG